MKRSKLTDEQILAIVKEGEAAAERAARAVVSMDFMANTLAEGRCFRTLNILDDLTRECVAIEVDRSFSCSGSRKTQSSWPYGCL